MNRYAARLLELLVLPVVLLAGAWTWHLHSRAWDLGGRSPILNYDTAQYALAARELAWHGKLATPYALPIELQKHATPPWPLAAVQPGMVLAQGLVFKVAYAAGIHPGSDQRASMTLMIPFACFLLAAASLALSVRHMLGRWSPGSSPAMRAGAAVTAGLAFVLDPEAQHFAIGGFTELPFTLGLLLALFGLAMGAPAGAPLAYGLLLGITGLFRANMMWLAPLFALGAMACAPPGRRRRTLLLVALGFVVPLAPWWLYKWKQFGSPGWDLTRFVVWDGIGGRNWFSLYHQASVPELPHGMQAYGLLAAKVARNLPALFEAMLLGPRGLWLGSLAGYLALTKPPRPLAAAGLVALLGAGLGVLSAAASIPWLRYLFPSRILLEPAGMLAAWALVTRLPEHAIAPPLRRGLIAFVAVLALGWGAWSTTRGLAEAEQGSHERGVPSSETLTRLSISLARQVPAGEPIMSNLGPALAWQTNHPVVHLALAPSDVTPCRRRLAFRHVVLVFRDARAAWGEWSEIMAREGAAKTFDLDVTREWRGTTTDGFQVVWLELAPLGPALASTR